MHNINSIVCFILIIKICRNIYRGIKKGAITAITHTIALFAALINLKTGEAIYGNVLFQDICIPVTRSIKQFLESLGSNLAAVPEGSAGLFSSNSATIHTILTQLSAASEDQISAFIYYILLFSVTYFISYYVVNIGLRCFGRSICRGYSNRVLGGIIGGLSSIIILWIEIDILILITRIVPPLEAVNQMLMSSSFYRLIYDSNITLKYLKLI